MSFGQEKTTSAVPERIGTSLPILPSLEITANEHENRPFSLPGKSCQKQHRILVKTQLLGVFTCCYFPGNQVNLPRIGLSHQHLTTCKFEVRQEQRQGERDFWLQKSRSGQDQLRFLQKTAGGIGLHNG